MIINSDSLRALYTGFSTAYQNGFKGVEPTYKRVATTVPSTTRSNEYGWMGEVPRIREWIGDRVIQNLSKYSYTIRNKPWEMTIGVDRDDIEDDNIGIFAPLFTEMGRATASFPDELVWPFLKTGFATPCYDGQYYFDTDHPVIDADGVTTSSVANTDGGAGAAWFLIDATRALLPVIFQQRRAFDFVRMDAPTDEVVFNTKKYRYGVDGRSNCGFGFWQIAWGSRQALDAAHYATARAALMNMKGDNGRPLGITPTLLVVPPSLESAGRKLLNSENGSGGETNEWKGTAELLVTPWLA